MFESSKFDKVFAIASAVCLSQGWVAVQTALAQQLEEGGGAIVVGVIAESREHLPLAPLHVWVELRNEGKHPRNVVISLPVILEYAGHAHGPWHPYMPLGSVSAPTPPRKIVLQPSEVMRWSFVVDFVSDSRGAARHLFSGAPAQFFLRAHVYDLTSEPVEIEVRKPTEEDSGALDFLVQHESIAWAFSDRIVSAYHQDRVNMDDVQEFIGRYGETLYGYYARIGVAILGLSSGKEETRPESIKALLAIGSAGPAALRARSLWYAAQAMEVGSERRDRTMRLARRAVQDSYFAVAIPGGVE